MEVEQTQLALRARPHAERLTEGMLLVNVIISARRLQPLLTAAAESAVAPGRGRPSSCTYCQRLSLLEPDAQVQASSRCCGIARANSQTSGKYVQSVGQQMDRAYNGPKPEASLVA